VRAVLIVEGRLFIRSYLVAEFELAGLIALKAEDANEALDILRASSNRIKVLFTGIVLPGVMNGLILARYVSENWPWIRIVIGSGRLEPSPLEMPSGARFFRKPYEMERLIKHIRQPA
jgi:DNA-binding NtrC family response regulator